MEVDRSVVLLVDDDAATRELVGSILLPRHEVLEAETVAGAVRHI